MASRTKRGRPATSLMALVMAAALMTAGALAGCKTTTGAGGESADTVALRSDNDRLVKELGDAKVQIKTLEDRVARLEAEKEAGGAAGGAGGSGSGSAGGGTSAATKQVGYIKKVTKSGGAYSLVIDYIQFLTGKAAEQAAIADGEIKPGEHLDNDYYIRNQNTKLRTFPISAGADVIAQTYNMSTKGVGKTALSLATFKDIMSGGDPDNMNMVNNPWWVTIKGGVLTRIEEQYLP